jgi:hypothetical protein
VWFLNKATTGLWQSTQLAATGVWLLGFPIALVPLWQAKQSVAAVNNVWSGIALFQSVVDLWQVSQTVFGVGDIWIGVDGRAVAPNAAVKWQTEHCALKLVPA